ncbi:AzlC family ABC transporter permease [Ornithinimicrobium humiphilum]|nr:AzlC family ABC transporter permease [Ornithinimicrobium humiphilum]
MSPAAGMEAGAAQAPVWWRTPAAREGMAVGLVGLYGVSAGALGVAAGLSVWQTIVTSLFIFSGGSQFALYGVIGAGGGPLAAVATSTLLGLRNGFYGLELSRRLRPGPRLLPINAHLTIDESTAVALAQPTQRDSRIGFWTTGIGLFVVWQSTTVVGALAGEAMGDPRDYGLDAAAAAAFVALVWPRLFARGAKGRTGPIATAALAMVLTLVSAPFVPTGVEVLIGASAAVLIGLRDLGRDTGDGTDDASATRPVLRDAARHTHDHTGDADHHSTAHHGDDDRAARDGGPTA